jgi:hypothetical protein
MRPQPMCVLQSLLIQHLMQLRSQAMLHLPKNAVAGASQPIVVKAAKVAQLDLRPRLSPW